MRIKHLVIAAAAAIVSLSASAEPQSATERVEVREARPAQKQMKPFFYDRVQGEYALDNGRVLNVTGANRVLYADMGEGKIELMHVGKGRFVAVDKDMRFAFTGDRIPDEVRISMASTGQTLALAKR
ncbi:hypothetical protein [Massilia niastensis]|uniref:hypothetical protein n=1 Tax=Massilia niastensis TaxID=544911 RepID=UPI00036669FF|nr:hypothetical protein [Massilia niastensis]